mmetsp:Transcript_95685/g.297910  ORF Transcript_95685/g.297910 Transcript_95685/m.297910 type:complete len:208 (+) Transcript_95685:361-984(+)
MRSLVRFCPRLIRRVFSMTFSSGHWTQPSQWSLSSFRSCIVSRFCARLGFTGSLQAPHRNSAFRLSASQACGWSSCLQETCSWHLEQMTPGRVLWNSFQRTFLSKSAFTSALAADAYSVSASAPPSAARAAAACAKREASMPRHSAMRAGSVLSTGPSSRETNGWTCCFLYHSMSTRSDGSRENSWGCLARSASEALGPSPAASQMT